MSMHYERAPRFRGSKLDVAPPSLRCGGAKGGNCSGAKEVQESMGKSAGEWQFTLRGRLALARITFPPKEATAMSRDIKYIGMDVHKEAIVIAVLQHRGTNSNEWGGTARSA